MRLIIPNYSMRSHETGQYSILKDGNFKLHINRINNEDLITIPKNVSDLNEFLDLNLIKEDRIVQLNYGKNAYETRDGYFWKHNSEYLKKNSDIDIITDITNAPEFLKIEAYNFNVSTIDGLPRSYVDIFFTRDVKSIKSSTRTTVLNKAQKDYFHKFIYDDSYRNRIVVDQKVIKKQYFDAIGLEENTLIDFDSNYTFFPFRLSDKAYKFEELLKRLHKSNTIIYVTDPNNSLKSLDFVSNYNVKIKLIKPNKRQYYYILSKKPTIYYYEDPNLVFHPGYADFLYFDCDIRNQSPCNMKLEDVLIVN